MPATATTQVAGVSDVGDTWLLGVEIRDDVDEHLVDATVVVTVTLPDDTTATPPVDRLGVGDYLAAYELTQPGRHFAVAAVSGDVVSVVTFAVAAQAPGTPPDVTAVQVYLQESAARWTVPQLQDVLDAEEANQAKVCRVGAVYPPDLRAALLRRVQRALALRALPIAVLQGDAEGGSTFLPGNDPDVRRLEGPHRRMVFA